MPLRAALSGYWRTIQGDLCPWLEEELGPLSERVNGRLKDDFGARKVRVRGPDKGLCHLMFGVLAFTVEQLMRLAT